MRLRKVIYRVLLLLLIVFFVTACSANNDSDLEKVQVSVSILPLQTFVEAVAKDKVEVNVVIPPGSSPATYEPTPQEASKLERSDLYFAIGVPTESANILPLINEDNTKLILLHQLVSESYPDILINGKRDPHIWLSPTRVTKMIEIIKDELILMDPDNASFYGDNATAYISELKSLDTYAKDKLANLDSNKFIVFHPAFRYLSQDFGLEMYELEQDGKEATPQRIAEMIEFAKEEGIKVIFYQAEFSSTQAQSFAEEIEGQTMMLAPLSPNYITNLRAMIDLIHEALNTQ